MGTDHDFSFPIISSAHPHHTIDSPPLWQTSPATSPTSCRLKEHSRAKDDDDDQEEDINDDCFIRREHEFMRRKSFSSVEKGSKRHSKRYNSEDEEEDKMDSLWEDFNIGDLSRSHSSKAVKGSKNKIPSSSNGDMVTIGCVQGLRLSSSPITNNNNNGVIISPRKPGSIMVFMNVFKKLFLLHNYHHHNHPTVKRKGW